MTPVLLLTMALVVPATPQDTFDLQVELQGLYDEISQTTLQCVTESDVDLLHDVLYTSDWVFVDATGQKRTWSQMRERAVHALAAPRLDSMVQPIQKLTLATDGPTVVVNMTTVRTIVDQAGQYGRQGATHTVTDTTTFRDRWVRVADEWKMKSREQITDPRVSVDKTDR